MVGGEGEEGDDGDEEVEEEGGEAEGVLEASGHVDEDKGLGGRDKGKGAVSGFEFHVSRDGVATWQVLRELGARSRGGGCGRGVCGHAV